MKYGYIIGVVVIALVISIIVSTTGDASTYSHFGEAKAMQKAGNESKVHVVGSVKKNAAGQLVMEYEPAQDPNLFRFVMIDQQGNEQQVVYRNPKPQDFEASEQVVIVGSMAGEVFKADKILLKCPSKYENGQVQGAETASLP